jgi:hypothetical protein
MGQAPSASRVRWQMIKLVEDKPAPLGGRDSFAVLEGEISVRDFIFLINKYRSRSAQVVGLVRAANGPALGLDDMLLPADAFLFAVARPSAP